MMLKFCGFVMVITALIGSVTLSLNEDYSRYGYIAFLISSIAGIYEGYFRQVTSLTIMSVCFTIINVVGVYRWILI
jgi:hypothetical protein